MLKTTDGKPNYKLATCCNPIPGDDVLGFVGQNNEVEVHRMECPMAMKLKSSYGGRIVQTQWDTRTTKFLTSISIEGIDRMGILQELIYLISTNLAINIRKLNIWTENGVFHCELDVLVEDTDVVTRLCKRLKKVKGVNTATRIS